MTSSKPWSHCPSTVCPTCTSLPRAGGPACSCIPTLFEPVVPPIHDTSPSGPHPAPNSANPKRSFWPQHHQPTFCPTHTHNHNHNKSFRKTKWTGPSSPASPNVRSPHHIPQHLDPQRPPLTTLITHNTYRPWEAQSSPNQDKPFIPSMIPSTMGCGRGLTFEFLACLASRGLAVGLPLNFIMNRQSRPLSQTSTFLE